MWFLICSLLVIIAVTIAILVKDEKKKSDEDKAVLCHTIDVNLSLLRAELSNLTEIAESKPSSSDTDEAKALLREARRTASDAGTEFDELSAEQLCTLLSKVFNAMDQTSKARHLLNACETGMPTA